MNISPLSDVVVIRQDIKNLSDGGIILVDSPDFREDIGHVVFAGKGRPYQCEHCWGTGRIPMQVKVGDKIIFSTHGHQITKVNGEELIVLRQESIIGVIDEEEG